MAIKLIIGTHIIEIEDEQKELFPRQHITKYDIITYYKLISTFLLPLIKNRPIVMECFPQGIDHQPELYEHEPKNFPDWIAHKKVLCGKERIPEKHLVINNEASLLFVINQYCVTPHMWLSTTEQIKKPNLMVFELSTTHGTKLDILRWAAKKLRILLQTQHLQTWPMSNGSNGLYIIVPMEPTHDFEKVLHYAHAVALHLVAEYPQILFFKHQNSQEIHGKVAINIQTNRFGDHIIAPYSLRAIPGAPVAMPLAWSHIETFKPELYTIKTVIPKLQTHGNPWHDLRFQMVDDNLLYHSFKKK